MNPGNEQEFDKELAKIGELIDKGLKQIPGAVKVIGLEFIADNFDKKGFEKSPGSVDAWPKRKESKNKKSRPNRSILVNKGHLKKSWKTDTVATTQQVSFTSHMPYAEVHNDGLKAGRGKGFIMPMRKMIGDSTALNKRVIDRVTEIVSETLKF